MAKKPKITDALKFAAGPQGQYIISRALLALVEKLEAVEGVHREVSYLSDANYILNELYSSWKELHSQRDDAQAMLFDEWKEGVFNAVKNSDADITIVCADSETKGGDGG